MSGKLLAILIVASTPVVAQEPAAPAPLRYAILTSDSTGVSHFGDEAFPWSTVTSAGSLRTELLTVQQLSFLRIGKGVRQDWHPSPSRQLILVLSGVVEVVAGDGERRRFAAGNVLLLADAEGAGHQTNILGNEDFLAATIPIPRD